MSRIEILMKMQELLQAVQMDIVALNGGANQILACAKDNCLISDSITQNLMLRLSAIQVQQKELKELYSQLGRKDVMPESVKGLMDIIKRERELEEKKEIINAALEALEPFHGATAELDLLLENQKSKLSRINVGKLNMNQCEAAVKPYYNLVRAVQETDPMKLYDYIQLLNGKFEKELIVYSTISKQIFMQTEEHIEENLQETLTDSEISTNLKTLTDSETSIDSESSLVSEIASFLEGSETLEIPVEEMLALTEEETEEEIVKEEAIVLSPDIEALDRELDEESNQQSDEEFQEQAEEEWIENRRAVKKNEGCVKNQEEENDESDQKDGDKISLEEKGGAGSVDAEKSLSERDGRDNTFQNSDNGEECGEQGETEEKREDSQKDQENKEVKEENEKDQQEASSVVGEESEAEKTAQTTDKTEKNGEEAEQTAEEVDDALNNLHGITLPVGNEIQIFKGTQDDGKFGIKKFKGDIKKHPMNHTVIRGIFIYEYVTLKLLTYLTRASELTVERETEKLLQKGYIRKYQVTGQEAFYSPSVKGYDGLDNEELLQMLRMSKLSHAEKELVSAEKTAYVTVSALFAKVLEEMLTSGRMADWYIEKKCIQEEFISYVFIHDFSEKTMALLSMLFYQGMDWSQISEMAKRKLKMHNQWDYCVVVGYDLQQARQIVEQFAEVLIEKVALDHIYCYDVAAKQFFSYVSDEKLSLKEIWDIMNADENEVVEEKIQTASEEIAVSEETPEVFPFRGKEDELGSSSKNQNVENEWSDEARNE
ncbi:MAG: hypothetical protein ACI4C1_10965, partial [Lachnospiraceae bacterium]